VTVKCQARADHGGGSSTILTITKKMAMIMMDGDEILDNIVEIQIDDEMIGI